MSNKRSITETTVYLKKTLLKSAKLLIDTHDFGHEFT